MMRKTIAVFVLVFFSERTFCQEDIEKLQFPHFFTIDAIKPEAFEDGELDFLLESTRNKRVVFLGEGNHGDGTSLSAKSRIIEFLVKNGGFRVLVLESNIYEVLKTNQMLKDRRYSAEYLAKHVLRVKDDYYRDNEARLIEVIAKNRSTLELAGMDLPYVSPLYLHLGEDLKALGISKSKVADYMDLLYKIMSIEKCPDCENPLVDYKKFEDLSVVFLEIIRRKRATGQYNSSKEAVGQVIKSNMSLANWVARRPPFPLAFDPSRILQANELRDRAMAENLIWTILRQYPNQRIIVSCATIHMTKGLSIVPVMADYLPDSIRKISLFVPFILYEGRRGYEVGIGGESIEEFSAPVNSVESSLHQRGVKFGYIDLIKLSDQQKEYFGSLSMAPSLLLPTQAKWWVVYDGVFFVDRMEPSRLKPITLKEMGYFNDVLYKDND